MLCPFFSCPVTVCSMSIKKTTEKSILIYDRLTRKAVPNTLGTTNYFVLA